MPEWSLQPIFNSHLLALLLAALLVALLWIKPRFPNADPQKNRLLTWLRLGVVLLVTLAMLRPTIVWTDNRSQRSTVAFVIDHSRSMNVPDAGNRTRWRAVRDTLGAVEDELAALRENYDVQTYLFDSRATNIPLDDDSIDLPEAATGDESDIGTSLDDVLRNEAGKRLATVFLLGDGSQRVNEPRVDLQQPARELARRGCPLVCVAFGESRDQSQARDVAVENLPDQFTVFVNNELEVQASLQIQGYTGRDIPVDMRIVRPDGTLERIGPVTAIADEQQQQVQVNLVFTPQQTGQHKITVRAEPQIGEQVIENNELSAFVTVLEGGLRVLYVDGNVGWQERKFIRRSLDESPDIQIDLWLDTRMQKNQALNLPLDSSQPYDVFMIGDISAAALGNENCLKIATAVGDGAGLIMLGGVYTFGPGGYARSPLEPALPVQIDRLERQSVGELIRPDVHLQGELALLPVADHFVTRLAPRNQNGQRWRELPPLIGGNRFRGLDPQAVVLIESDKGDPLLVAGKFGLGRVLAFAGDSTYRWYRYGHLQEHKRFWRQVMLWLAQKDETQQNDVWLRMLQRRFRPGSRAPFTLGVRDSTGLAIDNAEVQVELVGPGGYVESIRVTRDKTVWSGTSEALTAAGDYEYQATAFQHGEELGTARGNFLVLDQDLEMTDPVANPRQLQSLAQLTDPAGGKLIASEQLGSVLEELANQVIESEIEYQSRWQLADTTPDATVFFLGIFVLLVTEWFLRKRWGLV